MGAFKNYKEEKLMEMSLRLTSKEDAQTFISKVYRPRYSRLQGPATGDQENYMILIDSNNEDPGQYGTLLENYEDACIEILTKKELALQYISGDRLGEDIIQMFSYREYTGISPNVGNGNISQRLLSHVKVDDLVSKRVEKSSDEYQHQIVMLRALHSTKTPDIPGEAFWKKLADAGVIKFSDNTKTDQGDKK